LKRTFLRDKPDLSVYWISENPGHRKPKHVSRVILIALLLAPVALTYRIAAMPSFREDLF
jgi:hypothetical protein